MSSGALPGTGGEHNCGVGERPVTAGHRNFSVGAQSGVSGEQTCGVGERPVAAGHRNFNAGVQPVTGGERPVTAAQQPAGVVSPAHTLRGTFGQFAAGPSAACATQLEAAARRDDLAACITLAADLGREVERFNTALRHFLLEVQSSPTPT